MELYADIIGKILSYSAFEKFINPFHAAVLFLYPLKTSDWFSDIFRGYRKRPVA